MNRNDKVSYGSVKIAEDVISSIAAIAASEVEGVRDIKKQSPEKLSRKARKHVKLAYQDNGMIIDVYLVVKYGYTIPKVASQVQENVADAVEGMSGLKVDSVNVHCTGVSFSKDDAKNIK